MTFDSLKSDLRAYLERGDTAATDPEVFDQIPRLINLAERRIATELKLEGFVRVATTTMAAGTSVYPKPARWKRTVSMHIATGASGEVRKPLFPRSYEYLRSFWPDSTAQDEPDFYGDYDYEHWLVASTPDAAYPWEIVYWETPVLLDDANQTNWLTDHAPQMLLYACLLEATPFIKEDRRVPLWQQMYDRAAAVFSGEDISRIIDRAVTREGK
jgi:hypothetical protein